MTANEPAVAPGGRLAALRVYLHRRVLAMLFLGFSAGLPFPLVFATLSAWLSTAGVSKASIGMFAWVGITYSLKFTWAPLVDRLALPGITAWLGRRRLPLDRLAAHAGAQVTLAWAEVGAVPTTHTVRLLERHAPRGK